jgi:NADPH:quinone reductase-like Zn-dependent oxidoreductase
VCKALGAKVIVTASTPEHKQALEKYGGKEIQVIESSAKDFYDAVQATTNYEGVGI